jgi:ABC-type sulfate/molybdate transport systems ATPase subunit
VRPAAAGALAVRGFAVRVGRFVAGPLDLVVRRGEVVALLGPTRSGKTVILEGLAGLRAAEGGVWLGREPLARLRPEGRRAGFVPAEPVLFPRLTVRDQVARAARRREPAAWAERTDRALALAGLEGAASRRPAGLSAWDGHRVALARALAADPEWLLVDEPRGQWDPARRADLWAWLRRVLRTVGVPAVVATRDPQVAAGVADRVHLLREGRVVQWGTPEALFSRPAEPWAAWYLGVENLACGSVVGPGGDGLLVAAGRGLLALPEADAPPGTPVWWGVRACWVRLDPGEGGAPGRLPGRVQRLAFTGSRWLVDVDCGLPLTAELRPDAVPPEPGSAVTAVIPAERLLWWLPGADRGPAPGPLP